MSKTTVVVVYDSDDLKHGEVAAFDSPESAERLLESLLEAGFGTDRIRVFDADELAMRVSYRPVVALGEEQPGEPAGEAAGEARAGRFATDGAAEAGPEPVEATPRLSSALRSDSYPPLGKTRRVDSELLGYG